MADENSHSTDWSVSGEEGHSDPLRVAAEAGARLSTKCLENVFLCTGSLVQHKLVLIKDKFTRF